MPLLHQDNGRDGDGPRKNRHSWSYYNLDFPQAAEPAAVPKNENRSNEGGSGSGVGQPNWHWRELDTPASPEAALSPMSLVPPACFPPKHSTAFASYSESARPGEWSNEATGQMSDLMESMMSLSVAPGAAGGALASGQQNALERATYEGADKNPEQQWPRELGAAASTSPSQNLPRGGVTCRGNEEVLRWCGALPPRGLDSRCGYSHKVFLGGLPWDITEETLVKALRNFLPVRVEWPGREVATLSKGQSGGAGSAGGASGGTECLPRGYAYVTFESEHCVRALLSSARHDGPNWYYRVASRNMRSKEVQVIPWAVADSNWMSGSSVRLEPGRTVFVGALHGMLSAYALAVIMNDLFSGVVYAGIDTDKNKYPIGSGRVAFNNVHSYVRAVAAAFVEIATEKFTKIVQVEPYLEDSMCSTCNLRQGPYFCREPVCFRYYCRMCWARQHINVNHKRLMRNSKSAQNGAPFVSRCPPPAAAAAAGPYPALCPSNAVAQLNHPTPPSMPLPEPGPNLASSGSAVNSMGPAPAASHAFPMSSHSVTSQHTQSRADLEQVYHNGYKRQGEGTPSLSPSGSSDLEVASASESILQRYT